jgi:hypothetical protein
MTLAIFDNADSVPFLYIGVLIHVDVVAELVRQ